MISSVVAILAPTLNCIQLVPQVYKTYMTKKVNDLSFYSIFLFVITSSMWLLHGFFIKDYSVMISASFGIIVNTALLFLYITYRHDGISNFRLEQQTASLQS